MKKRNEPSRIFALAAVTVAASLIFGPANAQDDGARTYWKGRAGTNVMSVQYLNMNLQASDALQFDPSHFIYPAADAEANIFVLSWARHMTLFDRPSILSVNLFGWQRRCGVRYHYHPARVLTARCRSRCLPEPVCLCLR